MMEQEYKRIGSAVVHMAIHDYIRACKKLKTADLTQNGSEMPQDVINAMKMWKDCYNFFNGELIEIYCDYSGARIKSLLNKRLNISEQDIQNWLHLCLGMKIKRA